MKYYYYAENRWDDKRRLVAPNKYLRDIELIEDITRFGDMIKSIEIDRADSNPINVARDICKKENMKSLRHISGDLVVYIWNDKKEFMDLCVATPSVTISYDATRVTDLVKTSKTLRKYYYTCSSTNEFNDGKGENFELFESSIKEHESKLPYTRAEDLASEIYEECYLKNKVFPFNDSAEGDVRFIRIWDEYKYFIAVIAVEMSAEPTISTNVIRD